MAIRCPRHTLIIHGLRRSNLGEYTCLAENEAGVVGQKKSNTTQTDQGWLHIGGVKEVDGGWYTCEATSQQRTVTAEAYIRVQVPPTIVSVTSSPETVLHRGVANLTCVVHAEPTAAITWSSPVGLQLSNATLSRRYRVVGPSLIVRDARVMDDWGRWICVACNLLGCANSSTQLFVEGVPSIVNVTASKRGDVISIHCYAVGTPTPTVMYRRNDVAFDNFKSIPGHVVSYDGGLTLDGVNITERDVYSCVAENERGSVGRQLKMPARPHSPYVTDVTSHSVLLMWQDGDDSSDLPVTHYTIQLQIGDSATWRQLNRTVHRPPLHITDLHPYTLYRFRARANNVIGASAFSEVDQIRTLEAPPGAPADVRVQSDRDAVSLTWEHPHVLNGDPDNIIYEVRYRDLTLQSPEGVVEMVYRDVPREVHVRDVPYNSTYSFTIRAYNTNIGDGSDWLVINSTAVEKLRQGIRVTVLASASSGMFFSMDARITC
ncbi:PREDICTED: neural cell adhesion molecule 2-like [Priapulus caudatus]|uniref:Neural cell adhesion molecule 2-like n=1 Tax=Priapulus caudatus TaxID=37621 RepID=A0ABM1EJ58_PRICU|nr:PREDICTED: neural cell adhesion molecule 2-like [Priapulus caudatus]